MYSQSTIDQVEELDLIEVISKYVELQKKGANYMGKSPFTDEKSPSFSVSPSKRLWKCFSTGTGGNSPISFVMKKTGLSYPEAIGELCGQFGIEPQMDREQGEKAARKADEARLIQDINAAALEYFTSNVLDEKENLKEIPEEAEKQLSRASKNQIIRFQLGYAPDEIAGLKKHLEKRGFSLDVMVKAGLVNQTEDEKGKRSYDFFRNRIIFPIYTHLGKLVGFSGRAVTWEKGSPYGKVMNSRETAIYSKSKTLLGLILAKEEIRSSKTIIKVEGNFDVTAFHEMGLLNTVATLGTALTTEQVDLFAKFASNVVLAVDNDKAGLAKIERDVELCLQKGLNIKLWMSDVENEDPFDFCKRNIELDPKAFKSLFDSMCVDAIEYVAEYYFKDVNGIAETAAAQQRLVELLSKISNAALRNAYVKEFAKTYKIEKKDIETKISVEEASKKAKELDKSTQNGYKLPSYLSEHEVAEFNHYRFYADPKKSTVGYYFPVNEKFFERVSNCILRPIFHITAASNSKRILELISWENDREIKKIIILYNKAFVSQTDMEMELSNVGGFWFHGTKKQYQQLKTKLFSQFPICKEIRTLGWQREGFFAFANGIVEDTFKPVNPYGICMNGEETYFLPAFSKVYAEVQPEDDDYEQDRKFIYKHSNVTFKQWSELFYNVYKDNNNGMFAIAFVLASLFSDWIYSINSDFPLLYGFGQPRTGKTTMGRSLSRIFKSDSTPFNLNQGTQNALSRSVARVRNGLVHLDEFTNDIDEKKFQTCKGLFDRTGHEKGVMSNDNRTNTIKVNSTAYISSQYQPTRDGNSLYTRIILLTFSKKMDQFTQEENKLFQELSHMEKKGLSSLIVEVMRYRSHIESNFENRQFEIASQMKYEFSNTEIDGRVMKNVVVLCTIVDLLKELQFPFSYVDFYDAAKEVVINQSAVIAESDQLAEFFKMVQFLIFDYKLVAGEDYKIEEIEELSSRTSKGTERKQFDAPTKVIHFNFSRTYPLYNQYTRSQRGENGLPETTIKSYMRTHKAFVGTPASVRFARQTTSAYTFVLDKLPVELEIQAKTPTPATDTAKENQTGNYNTPGISNQGFTATQDDDLPF